MTTTTIAEFCDTAEYPAEITIAADGMTFTLTERMPEYESELAEMYDCRIRHFGCAETGKLTLPAELEILAA